MDKEIFKPIKGYEGLYEVSNHGRVKSLPKTWKTHRYKVFREERIMKNQVNRTGYLYVTLSKDKVLKKNMVSRLVGEAFIPNPEKKPEINHIDEIKDNNYYENLEWVTKTENMHHNGLMKRLVKRFKEVHSKVVYQYSKQGELVKIWDSQIDARRAGFTDSAISACCSGKQKSHGGYIWSNKNLRVRMYCFNIDGKQFSVKSHSRVSGLMECLENYDGDFNEIKFVSDGIARFEPPEHTQYKRKAPKYKT